MQIKLKNIKQNNIMFFDIEFTEDSLVQFAALIYKKVAEDIFELETSMNYYIRQHGLLNKFFINYTNITDNFLIDNGCDLDIVKETIEDILFKYSDSLLVVSHGVDRDIEVLKKNGINLCFNCKYCTYDSARRMLGRNNKLTLKDVAADGGYYMYNEHNAYADVCGTLFSFCYLNRLEVGGRERV